VYTGLRTGIGRGFSRSWGNYEGRPSFPAYSTIQPHLITQAEFYDLVRDLDLPKTKADPLGSRLQQWKLLEKGVKMSLYRKRQANITSYF
jgi:hypothetical protein